MTDRITFTLAEIRKHKPCVDRWKKLLDSLGGIKSYGKDTPITVRQIYESNGFDDTLWVLRTAPEETHNLWRHFAVDCAEFVQHLTEDERSREALVVARKHANGEASDRELSATWAAARAATSDAASDAARAAAWDAAWDASRAAAWDAAWDAFIDLLEKYCRKGERVMNAQQIINQSYQENIKEK